LTARFLLIFVATGLLAQNSLFLEYCANCHGADAGGSDRAPKLAGSRNLRGRSIEDLRAVINRGIPSAGMPAFDLPPSQLDALAAFVHSLNTDSEKTSVSADPAAGKQFFFGKGGCGACHMVRGNGKPIGPDLSNVGREMRVSDIQNVLLHPDAHIKPGYELVTVNLRNGQRIRGFARGRSNFDLQLQDLSGQFHLFVQSQIAEIHEEKQSLMKPLQANDEEFRDLLAYLSQLTGVQPGATENHEAHEQSSPRPDDWLSYNGKLSGNRYSELSQINMANVKQLAVKWVFPIAHFGLEVTPIVADGIMYVTGANQAFALDARTGRQIWSYSRPRTQGLIGDASLGTNRGLAILEDKIFMETDNAHLIALNRVTGALVWEVVMPDELQHYGATLAPLVVKDTVIAGVSGGDRGIRGFLDCYKASTGERIWRKWTIPGKNEPGYETWKGKPPDFGGGGTWSTGTYDPETDTLYWPTGNPYPDSDDRDRQGDNLFTDCILALHPDSGKLKWYYQFTPHDVHDWDANEPPVLVNTQYRGENKKLLIQANRNGFFYVLDRTNGKLLLAKPFSKRITWTSGIGPDGRPQPLSSAKPKMDCPRDATNWSSTVFSPVTRLYYFIALDSCRAKDDQPEKYLRAVNIDTGKVTWEVLQRGTVLPKNWPGVLGTAGGLLFYGDPNGAFVAADERNGNPLWHFPTNVPMKASPMTYMLNGKQYVAIAAGSSILCFGLP
jgi:PQQ-dependent dehydrogenase (methanol/ethanol family)